MGDLNATVPCPWIWCRLLTIRAWMFNTVQPQYWGIITPGVPLFFWSVLNVLINLSATRDKPTQPRRPSNWKGLFMCIKHCLPLWDDEHIQLLLMQTISKQLGRSEARHQRMTQTLGCLMQTALQRPPSRWGAFISSCYVSRFSNKLRKKSTTQKSHQDKQLKSEVL